MSEASGRYFIDTNIWLYAFFQTESGTSKQKIARSLVDRKNVVVSTQVINEVCVNLIKKALMGEAEIQQLVQDFYARCQVIEFNCQILMNASRLRQGYNLSFWDSLIVACALEAGVEMLYSEDMHNGLIVSERLRIVNPFEPGKG